MTCHDIDMACSGNVHIQVYYLLRPRLVQAILTMPHQVKAVDPAAVPIPATTTVTSTPATSSVIAEGDVKIAAEPAASASDPDTEMTDASTHQSSLKRKHDEIGDVERMSTTMNDVVLKSPRREDAVMEQATEEEDEDEVKTRGPMTELQRKTAEVRACTWMV